MTQATSAAGWPVLRGIQTVKEVSYLNMRQASAAAALAKLWSDTFLTNAGIYAAGSSGYTYRGATNFDVIKDSVSVNIFPTMTSNSAPSGVCSASAESQPAYYAFNNSIAGDGWQIGSPAGWLKYAFAAGTTKTPVSYTIRMRAGGAGYAPKNWTFQGSNDDINWTVLDTQTNITNWTSDLTFNFANTTAFRYFKIDVTLSNDGTYTEITEWLMYEASATSASIVSLLALDLAVDVTQVMMFADVTLGTGTAAYYASTDDGVTWTAVIPETIAAVPAGKKIRIKVELTGNAELESWGVAA